MGMYPAPPPPPRQKSFARAIFLTLATTIFSLSLLANLYLLLWAGLAGSAEGARSDVVVGGDVDQVVAVVPVGGIITGDSARQFDRIMGRIESDGHVKALVIEIDTPGGEVTASDEIHHRIQRYKASHPGVPVVVSMGQLATSGGYYIACAADHIVAQPTTMTGNIGVLMMRFNLTGLMDKVGVRDATLHSTGADFKEAGSMFKPDTAAETAYIQDLIDQAFGQFKRVIEGGRGGKLTRPIGEIANGKVYMAADALKLGLIDEEGYGDDAYAAAAARAGLTKMKVVRYKPSEGLWGLLSARSNLTGSGETGLSVHVDSASLAGMMSPRMMYLWQGR